MSEHRKPAAFTIEPERPTGDAKATPKRAPVAKPAAEIIEQPDPFEIELPPQNFPVSVSKPKRGWSAGSVFTAAFGILVSLALGLWIDGLIRDLLARSQWLGYAAMAAAFVGVLALVIIAARELAGLARLNTASRFRARAAMVIEQNDTSLAQKLVSELDTLLAAVPETARGRALLKASQGEIIDGSDLIKLAETGLLAPLDARARTMILDSSKRVSVVTAVSPRALIDVAFVVYESARLIRRLAELYGGRPGTLGMWRLGRRVIAHLAVTGSIAIGDSLVQQLVGHGLAAKLSARLGEGVINGLMTARVGIAAMDLVRPLPFNAVKRPGIGDFLSEIARLPNGKTTAE